MHLFSEARVGKQCLVQRETGLTYCCGYECPARAGHPCHVWIVNHTYMQGKNLHCCCGSSSGDCAHPRGYRVVSCLRTQQQTVLDVISCSYLQHFGSPQRMRDFCKPAAFWREGGNVELAFCSLWPSWREGSRMSPSATTSRLLSYL